jgi:hypothetical protein
MQRISWLVQELLLASQTKSAPWNNNSRVICYSVKITKTHSITTQRDGESDL